MKKILFSMAVLAFAGFVAMGATSKQGQLQGKVTRMLTAETINGTATATGTGFKAEGNVGYLSLFYQATQGTSTPHYRIDVFTSPDDSSYTTLPVATATASTDETSTDFKHVDVAIPITSYIRVDVVGVDLNATNTTFDMWRVEQ